MSEQPSNWNVPNALTTLRIALVPVLGWVLIAGAHDPQWRWWAFGIFSVAMITDKIDGDLARKHGLITDFGKIADPIADKAMTGMALIGLAVLHDFLPAWVWWTVTVVILVREWSVTFARLSIAKHVVMAANRSGKVKTVMQTVALGGFIAPFGHLPGIWGDIGMVLWGVSAVLLAGATVLTITSGLEFARDARAQTRARRAERASA